MSFHGLVVAGGVDDRLVVPSSPADGGEENGLPLDPDQEPVYELSPYGPAI